MKEPDIKSPQGPLTVLISSIGRRTQLVRCFQQAFEQLGIKGRVIGVDSNPDYAPAAHLVEECRNVPPCTDPAYAECVLSICQERDVCLVVPTIDPELPVYAAARDRFRLSGIQVAISGPRTVHIAGDKAETNTWLRSKSIPTLRQTDSTEASKIAGQWPLPLMVKPRRGSASVGVRKITSYEMLHAMLADNSDLLIEEFAQGEEYTINVFVDSQGRCVCAVPHRRIEVRGGEVSKGITVKNPLLIQLAKQIVESLPDAFGPLNIQCFLSDSGAVRVTEINARFGGGFPLANEAGAAFPVWLLEGVLGLPSTAKFDGWTDKLIMLRYDSAVYFKSSQPW
jgi:carbamoyl-phosphate synthase large subunit